MGQALLDAKDERILAELDQDARAPASAIAKKVRLHKSVVNYRIKNLEKAGVVKGYYAVIDAFKLGYQGYRVYLKLQYADPATEQRIMQHLIKENSTWWVGFIKGEWNIGALFWVKDETDFVAFWNGFLSRYRNYVEDYRVAVYHGLHHFKLPFTKMHLKEKAGAEIIGGRKEAEIDETDLEILKLIGPNAKMPLLEMASKLGLTPGAVSYRLKKLIEKKVIAGFRAIIDMPGLGYTHYKLDFNLRDYSELEAMNEFARQHESIFYLNKSIGWCDYEIELYTKTTEEFFSVLNEMRGKFRRSIKDYDFFTFSEITKLLYVPAE